MRKFACLLLFALLLMGVRAGAAGAQEKTHTNSIGMEFVLIPAGSFVMGCNPNIEKCDDDETPRHKVTISRPFYIGKNEVTQAQWVAVMGGNRSKFKGGDNPVERVSWDDVQEFIRRLNAKEGHSRYRLPTEAEWEYAARAGTSSTYFFGDDESELSSYGWYRENSGGSTRPVGQKPANAWGLYDVHGNVWEWVQDWYDENYYANSPGTDPKGPSGGSRRVFRGGSWYGSASYCRAAFRLGSTPADLDDNIGFRLALSPGQ